MLKKTILTLFCTGCCGLIFAQADIELLAAKYQDNKRDVKAVSEYVNALKEAKMKKQAEDVVMEYMSRCPVIQVGDKDTYLLINQYVFADPYSNVFEYGIYAVKKMKWDRVEQQFSGQQERLRSIFKGLGSGVSGGDEVDKRYEVLMLLSNALQKEIGKQCEPKSGDGGYKMPGYDREKMKRLNYLVNKGELLRQDGMRMKLEVAKALHEGNYSKVIRDICVAAEAGITGVKGGYTVGVMSVIADCPVEKPDLEEATGLVKRLCEEEEKDGGGTNYYNVLGRLYALGGDKARADKYTRMGDAVEAERRARYDEMMKEFK